MMYRLRQLVHTITGRSSYAPGKPRNARRKIVLLRTFGAPLATYDEAALRQKYNVVAFTIVPSPMRKAVMDQALLVLFLLWHLPRADGVFWQFADWFGAVPVFLCRLMKKNSWIVLGGYDAHHLPEYEYGAYIGKVRGTLTRYTVRNATSLLPVHGSLLDGVNNYIQPSILTGVYNLVPNLQSRHRTIHIGWDGNYWHQGSLGLSENPTVVCIANVTGQSQSDMWTLKGVPMFLQVAEHMPKLSFLLVGAAQRGDTPKNVTVMGRVSRDRLREILSQAWVYAHPSLTESMSTSVGEAMLCECVPVVSGVNGDADLVGDTGIVVGVQDVNKWVKSIENGIEMTRQGKGTLARDRMLQYFSLERRSDALLEVVSCEIASKGRQI
jgi:glycosyltransferase involved in cell wall biosynthesis